MSQSPSGFQGYCQPADDCFTRQSVFSEKPAPKRRGALIRNPSLSERDKTDQDVVQTGVCRNGGRSGSWSAKQYGSRRWVSFPLRSVLGQNEMPSPADTFRSALQTRTLLNAICTSHLCHHRTHAPQQAALFDHHVRHRSASCGVIITPE